MLLKLIIFASEIQIARYLSGQPELKFRFKIDLFNYYMTSSSETSSKNPFRRDDVMVNLIQLKRPNTTTPVNQTRELLEQTINKQLKFEKNPELE